MPTIPLNPPPGGSVTPSSGDCYDSGSTGGATDNPFQLTINAPTSLTATFNVPGFTCAVTHASNDDLNRDKVVSAADVQKVNQEVVGPGCIY